MPVFPPKWIIANSLIIDGDDIDSQTCTHVHTHAKCVDVKSSVNGETNPFSVTVNCSAWANCAEP